MKYVNIILFSVIVSEAIISCGGGGSSGGGEKNPIRKIEGYVIDGNISEANVSIYESNNTIYEANVSAYNEKYKIPNGNTTTDKSGKYSFSIDSNISDIDIISYGGEDTLSEEIFEGILQARVSFDDGGLNNKIFVTPLSTLLAVSGGDKSGSGIIKYNLGIGGDFNLMNDNPLDGEMDDGVKLKLFQGTVQVQKVAEIIKDTLGDDIYYEQIFKAIYLTMADNYNSNNRAVVDEKEILKSSKFIENVVSFVKSDNKEKAKIKLGIISAGIESTVNLIYGDDVKISDIKLTAMAIEVVTNSYEEKAKEINKAVDLDEDVFGLKSDVDDIKLSYVSIAKVKNVVVFAQSFAKENDKVLSLPLLGAFLAKKISSSGFSDLENKNIKNTIDQSVVTQEIKDKLNNYILSDSSGALTGGTGGGGFFGSGGGGGGGRSGYQAPSAEVAKDFSSTQKAALKDIGIESDKLYKNNNTNNNENGVGGLTIENNVTNDSNISYEYNNTIDDKKVPNLDTANNGNTKIADIGNANTNKVPDLGSNTNIVKIPTLNGN